jgi:nitric oxide synthase oxygenase domain/subunit
MKAFPTYRAEGMELVDYFAAQALPLAMEQLRHNYTREMGKKWSWNINDAEEIAAMAYALAIEMMKARAE